MLDKAQQQTIDQAITILADLFKTEGEAFTSPLLVARFCQLNIAHLEHEVFGVLFLNTQHELISFEIMFRGTIDAASIYPREVAKAALLHNAAAVIFTHNHPSGCTKPSEADKRITSRLVDALQLLDVRTLDHIIATTQGYTSFAETGLL